MIHQILRVRQSNCFFLIVSRVKYTQTEGFGDCKPSSIDLYWVYLVLDMIFKKPFLIDGHVVFGESLSVNQVSSIHSSIKECNSRL